MPYLIKVNVYRKWVLNQGRVGEKIEEGVMTLKETMWKGKNIKTM